MKNDFYINDKLDYLFSNKKSLCVYVYVSISYFTEDRTTVELGRISKKIRPGTKFDKKH